MKLCKVIKKVVESYGNASFIFPEVQLGSYPMQDMYLVI